MAKTTAERQAEHRKKRDVTVESLRNEIEGLQAEVASLKRQLSEARKGEMVVPRLAPGIFMETPAGPVMGRRARASEVAASQNANKYTMSPHGPRCQGICCRGRLLASE